MKQKTPQDKHGIFNLQEYDLIEINRRYMEKVFIDISWLWGFFDKEGIETYNSLVASNRIVSNGIIAGIFIKIPRGLLK